MKKRLLTSLLSLILIFFLTSAALGDEIEIQDQTYSVKTADEFSAAITAIGQEEQTEATIVLGADLTGENSIGTFQGVEGKKITVTSAEGAVHTLNIPGECVLKGDVTLDRIILSVSTNTGIYACGHTFETTENFQGFGTELEDKLGFLFGGGPLGQDVEGDTNIILRGAAAFGISNLYGGGLDSNVSGSTHVLIDGKDIVIGSLVGGGHAGTDYVGTGPVGQVGGDTNLVIRQGTASGVYGGGINMISTGNGPGAREPARVKGDVHIIAGYNGASENSVLIGSATFVYAGSWHSTVRNVVMALNEGVWSREDNIRKYFGCGYRDTVRGTVTMLIDGMDGPNDYFYGGGDCTDTMGPDYGPVEILNENNEEYALQILFRSDTKILGINAGSALGTGNQSIATHIHGNALVDVLGGDMEFIVMDSEDYAEKNCTIDGACTIRIAGGGKIGQIQNNYKHFKDDGAAAAVNDRVIYDGCGSADAPQVSGYLYGFGEVALRNSAHVLVSSTATGYFGGTQKPFFSVYGLNVEEGSTLTTTDDQAHIYGNAVVDGVWEQAYKEANNYNDLWVKGTLTVGSKGQLISQGTTTIKGDVTSQGTIALMSPALFKANYTGTDAELRLPAVATGSNYDGTAAGGDIPLNIDGAASGATMVYTVAPDHWETLQKPNLGDNYITAFKQDANTPLQEVFLLGNEDALRESLYLKRVNDPGVDDGSYFMWQVAKGILVIFDKNGGDTEAQPRIIALDLVPGQAEYTPGVPEKLPTRGGYAFDSWNTAPDGSGTVYDKDTAITETTWVFAQWRELFTVTYDLNGGNANGKDYSPVTVSSGTEVTVKDAPVRNGYVFTGWSDGTNIYQPGATLTVLKNITLTAQWRKSDGGNSGHTTYYTLHYESNGGTQYKNERYVKNIVVQLDKVPVREGYQFTGWYADQDLTEQITSIKMTRDKTVYAGWRTATVPDMLNGDDHFAYVIGYTDGTVRPNANISRSEVAAIFFRLLKPEVRDGSLTSFNTFTDVNEGMWYNKSISTMAALNIVKGRSAERFDPDAPITRAEFAAICARFDTGMTEGSSNFTDISGHWAEAEIERAASLGWIMGYTDGTFRPDNYITRAEAMTTINRVLCRIPEDEDDLLPGMNVWPDNQPGAWYYPAVQEATNSHNFRYKGEIYEHWTELTADPDWTRYQD